MANGQTGGTNAPLKKDFFGHPRGLSTLFFTEFWERFSYYGMRALLVLFLVASVTGENPGLGMTDAMATAIYGIYTFFVYVLALPGGWVADNIWGQRRSVFVGGCIIALGHFTMAAPLIGLPEASTFYLGLAFITIGTGLLKPNVSVMVGGLYPEGGARRDAGFSIFYMGINFGAIFGPTLCSLLGEGYNWHWGFSLAGFGMLVGLIWYKYGEKYLGDIGTFQTNESDEAISKKTRNFYIITAISIAFVGIIAWLMSANALGITLEELARFLGVSVALIAVVYFTYLILDARWIIGVLLFTTVCFIGYTTVLDTDSLLAFQNSILLTVAAFLILNIARVMMPTVQVTLEKKRLMVIFWLF
ncbi:MAG TPA: peptide MFS transporter, partial [Balneolaceae bacterium]|nr:peptide MFS transporter [Balneolaceae bacterium]